MYNDGSMYMDHQTNRMNGHMQPQHTQMRDVREGNSPIYRRMYMEGKHQKDPQKQMQELEDYMHELTNDIMEMIEDATPEEKQLLRQKITTLSTKIK
jgi:predicted transcriptional regulator